MKTVTVELSEKTVRRFLAEFMTFAYEIQEGLDDDSGLSFRNGCPVAQEMLGAGVMTLLEHLVNCRAVDITIVQQIARNIDQSILEMEGLKGGHVRM